MIFYRLLILKACRDYLSEEDGFLEGILLCGLFFFFDEKINGNDALVLLLVNQLVCLEIEPRQKVTSS